MKIPPRLVFVLVLLHSGMMLCSCRLSDSRIEGSFGYLKNLPVVTFNSPSPLCGDSSTTFDFPVVYNQANTVNLTASDVTVNSTGTVSCDPPVVLNGTSDSPTVTINNCTGSGTLGITIRAGTSQNDFGRADLGSKASATAVMCPSGYIPVPGSGTTQDFCVMKYEAKLLYDTDGDGDYSNATIVSDGNASDTYDYDTDYDSATSLAKYKAVSDADGRPWVYIMRGENGGTTGQGAIEACQELNTQEGVSNNYDLMTNNEWQTLARNIAAQPSNWDTDSFGDTVLNHGNADDDPAQSCNATQAYVDTDCNNSGNETDFAEKRTHSLSNGEVIWDVAGNVWEWMKDNNTTATGLDSDYWTTLTDADSDGISDSFVSAQDAFGPLDLTPSLCTNPSTNNRCGLGFIFDGSSGAVLRGGGWVNAVGSGVFYLNLGQAPKFSTDLVGFRCVFRP